MYQLKDSVVLNISLDEAWDFFSRPVNLSRLTPDEMNLKVSQHNDHEIQEGVELEFEVAPVMGISINWTSKITKVKKKEYFIDEQIKGPFAYWRHEHRFAPAKHGTIVTDILTYKMPFGGLGKLAQPILVRKKIDALFEFRKSQLEEIFGTVETL